METPSSPDASSPCSHPRNEAPPTSPDANLQAAQRHRDALETLRAGNAEAARRLFEEALHWRRAAGDVRKEAATWHELARLAIQLNDLPASADAYGQTLELARRAGDRDLEATALHEIGLRAWKTGKRSTGLLLVAVSFTLLPPHGTEAEQQATQNLATMAAALGYGMDRFPTVLSEAVAEYEHDRAQGLVAEAWSIQPDSPFLPPKS